MHLLLQTLSAKKLLQIHLNFGKDAAYGIAPAGVGYRKIAPAVHHIDGAHQVARPRVGHGLGYHHRLARARVGVGKAAVYIVCLLLRCLQLHIPPLVFGFGFVEQQLGEHPLVGQGQHRSPAGNIAPGQRIYGVDVLKRLKRPDARPYLQRCRSRAQKPVLGFDKFG